MNTKLMTGVAAIALVLPALVLESTDVAARGGGRGGGHAVSHAAPARGGGRAVSHASAPARVIRPSVARNSIHTQAARPMQMIRRIGPNAHVSVGVTQPMHTSSGGASQPMHTSNGNASQLTNTSTGHTTNATLPGGTSGSHLPPFQASGNNATHAATLTGANTPANSNTDTHGHANTGNTETKAQQITDLTNRAAGDRAKAIDATKRAAGYSEAAAQQTQDAQTDRSKGQLMFDAAKAADKAGNHANALSLYKSSAEAFGAANTADNNAKLLNADAVGQTRRAGLMNGLSKADTAQANKLADGSHTSPKGDGNGSSTKKTGDGDGSGAKNKGDGDGSSTKKKGDGDSSGTKKKTTGGDNTTTTNTTNGGQGAGASQTGNGDFIGNGNNVTINNTKIDDRHRGRGGGSGSADSGSAGSVSFAASGGGSTGGGSAGASGGAASAVSATSTAAPTTAATTSSADTTATQAANQQSQCLVKINLQDRVLFKDVCTGQWATTPPVQPAQAEAQQQ